MLCNLPLQDLSASAFAPYGQVIYPAADGAAFGPEDAQLDLKQGKPRFYIMHLEHRGRQFSRITRHQQCTQCLGSLASAIWYIAVAPPSDQPQPDRNRLQAFRVPGNCFIKLAVGAWHAGPYFDAPAVDFYNLELSDTNVVDHTTHNFQDEGITFTLVD